MHKLPDLIALCEKIESQWNKYDRDCKIFPEIVLELTKNFDFERYGELKKNIEILDDPFVASLQKPSSFSNLNMKLYESKNIYVELLHWWKKDITIHDHDFSGVQFQIKGRSLNVVYDFFEEKKYGRIQKGELVPRTSTVWNPGDRSVVNPGNQDPHMVMHLSEPTVSLLIRTQPRPYYAPQKNYLFPSMSICYDIADSVFRKKIAAIDLFHKIKPSDFKEVLSNFLNKSSDTEKFFILEKLQDLVFRSDNVDLIQSFSKKGEVENFIAKALVYRRAFNYLSKSIKSLDFLSDEDRLSVSIIMSSYDDASRLKIIEDLRKQDVIFDIENTFDLISQNLPTNDFEKFKSSVAVFGL